jgi:hypothetical protein
VASRVINQDAAHQLCRDRKEVGSVMPLHMLLLDEPEVCFIYQSSRLQRVANTLSAHVAMGQPAQFLIDERQQAVECRLISSAPVD